MNAIREKDADLAEKLAGEHMQNAYEYMANNGLFEIYAEQEKSRG